MIKIENKKDCCGCASCVQKCPKHCISLIEDNEGFLYPKVDEDTCINCGLCERICPIINPLPNQDALAVYAARNTDESIREKSSSGGIFTALAENVIAHGGVVFGACFNDNWEVVHEYVDSLSGLEKFRGSKYVQSKIGNTFREAGLFLKDGRKVLFSGTPCQIEGLHRFLRKEYENLLTVDFICHGVPSPGVFRTFLRDEMAKAAINGGRKNSVLLSYKRVDKHPYMDGFLKDLYLRPSCYSCPAKNLSSGSDITMGDYWGIETLMPQLNDDKGISVVTVNTPKGKEAVSCLSGKVVLFESKWSDLIQRNPALIHSAKITDKRSLFFADDGKTFEQKIKILCKVPFSFKGKIIELAQIIPHPVRRLLKRILKIIGIKRL